MTKTRHNDTHYPRRISRREFLAGAATVAAAGLLAGCRSAQESPTQQPQAAAPTDAPRPTDPPLPTIAPTETSRPTSTPLPAIETRRPEVIRFWPDAPSKVVHTHHAGVWTATPQDSSEENGLLDPDALRQMLDASIAELTGLESAQEAWASLFNPDERIAIKVNAFRNSLIWTHVPLVAAVTGALQDAGIPAEQIVIFDCGTGELEDAGFPVNEDGPGVRCHGNGLHYTGSWDVAGREAKLSDILLSCHALINMPVLKSHMLAGMSFALKNHYGTIPNPGRFHSNIGRTMAELNALPPIKERTRLIIGDVLTACLTYSSTFPYWDTDYVGDSIMMSFDPVAHDTVGLQMLSQLKTDAGGNPASLVNVATPCLESGAELGLGTHEMGNIELVELDLEGEK